MHTEHDQGRGACACTAEPEAQRAWLRYCLDPARDLRTIVLIVPPGEKRSALPFRRSPGRRQRRSQDADSATEARGRARAETKEAARALDLAEVALLKGSTSTGPQSPATASRGWAPGPWDGEDERECFYSQHSRRGRGSRRSWRDLPSPASGPRSPLSSAELMLTERGLRAPLVGEEPSLRSRRRSIATSMRGPASGEPGVGETIGPWPPPAATPRRSPGPPSRASIRWSLRCVVRLRASACFAQELTDVRTTALARRKARWSLAKSAEQGAVVLVVALSCICRGLRTE